MKTLTIVIEPKRVFARVTEDPTDVIMLEAVDNQSYAGNIAREMHGYLTKNGWDCQMNWHQIDVVSA